MTSVICYTELRRPIRQLAAFIYITSVIRVFYEFKIFVCTSQNLALDWDTRAVFTYFNVNVLRPPVQF